MSKKYVRVYKVFMVTHSAIPSEPGGVPVRMINASIMESMDYSHQHT